MSSGLQALLPFLWMTERSYKVGRKSSLTWKTWRRSRICGTSSSRMPATATKRAISRDGMSQSNCSAATLNLTRGHRVIRARGQGESGSLENGVYGTRNSKRKKEIDSGARVEYHDFVWPAYGHGRKSGIEVQFRSVGYQLKYQRNGCRARKCMVFVASAQNPYFRRSREKKLTDEID